MSQPPIKYCGGKGKLIEEINNRVPNGVTVLVEPFCGSAAFSFSHTLPFYIWDMSRELINFFTVLRDRPEDLIDKLTYLKRQHQEAECPKEHYLAARYEDRFDEFPGWCEVRRAARYYFIIYTGYNGLYRVNKSGHCNTPYGERKFVVDEQRLRECSKVLQERCRGIFHCEFDNNSLLRSMLDSDETPFVLIDPPYIGKYDQYVADRPNDAFWKRLGQFMDDLNEADIPFLMTNSDDPRIYEMYGHLNIEKVPTTYSIAADGSKRGKVWETFTSNK